MNLISLSKVAEKCDVSTKTVRKWIADGTFPQHTTELPGGHKRWVEVVIDMWIMQQKPGQNPAPVKSK